MCAKRVQEGICLLKHNIQGPKALIFRNFMSKVKEGSVDLVALGWNLKIKWKFF